MNNIVDEKVKSFWEHNHRPKNIAWLGKPDILDVYKNHNIIKSINGSCRLKIMEIGVGVGDSVRHLAQRHDVTAVDISSSAIKKVEKIARVYLTEEMPKIPSNSIDLAFSNLVIPHCSEEMVDYLLSQTLRVIKKDGIFSFQSGYCRKMFDGLWKECFQNGARINFLDRDENKMKEIISRNGGEIVRRPPSLDFKRNNMTWHFFHIRRKNGV